MRVNALLAGLAGLAVAAGTALAADVAPAPPVEAPAGTVECSGSRACIRQLGRGHVCAEGRCTDYYDVADLYSVLGLRKGGARLPPAPWVPLVAAIPVVGYSPAAAWMLGFAGNVGMLLGDAGDTTMSCATASLLFTTKGQTIVSVSSTAMTAGNSWELLGDWRFLLFNQDTYGLGTGPTPLGSGISIGGWGDLAAVPGAQPMDFDLWRFHQSALRHVTGNLYLGLGYRLDRYAGIVDRRLDLEAATPVVTSHYAYSRIQGFDPGAYTASGFTLEALSDARDSTISPYRGWYAHLRFTGYPTWLGSDRSATLAAAEGRAYVGLSEAHPRSLLALWVLAQGVTSGRLPYLALPASGWDARSTTGRGYVQGRFRGTAQVYAEAEWRFRLTAGGLLGGTVFANAQTLARPPASLPQVGYTAPGEHLFETIRPAGGVGLRIMALKDSRTALRVDVAAGQGSVCFYFGAGEAF
jgi:hypothetical protein